MSDKTSYDADEWALLLRSPSLAGAAVMAASPSGPIGIVKEMLAAGRMLADVKREGSDNALIAALVADLQTDEGRARGEESMEADFMGVASTEVRAHAVDGLRRAAALVNAKAPPQEAQEFRAWLRQIAGSVAEAAKEGGFLGFGGEAITAPEQEVLAEVSDALGLDRGAAG